MPPPVAVAAALKAGRTIYKHRKPLYRAGKAIYKKRKQILTAGKALAKKKDLESAVKAGKVGYETFRDVKKAIRNKKPAPPARGKEKQE